MRYQHSMAVGVLLVLFGGCSEPRENKAPAPAPATKANGNVREIDWVPGGRDFTNWGQSSTGFFGASMHGGMLQMDVWSWQGSEPVLQGRARLPDAHYDPSAVRSEYLAYEKPVDDGDWPVAVVSLDSGQVLRRWQMPKDWECRQKGISRNGQFAGLFIVEDPARPPADMDWDRPRFRFAVVPMSADKLPPLMEWVGRSSGALREVAVSDDGKCAAIAGWENGVLLLDVALGKVRWSARPPEAISIGYAAFSADGSALYAADHGGPGIYLMDPKDGAIKRRWWATESGKQGRGDRIGCMALSPDGQWIAAASGEAVFLYNTAGGDKPRVLNHGQNTLIVSFSPDSAHLASAGGGVIRVWDLK